MVVKTYRGLLASGDQEKIPLSTKDGSVGYRIIKFELIPKAPGTVQAENTVKIYNEEQATVDGTINFSDNSLLGAGYFLHQSSATLPYFSIVIFDKEVFNQDVFITCNEPLGGREINYYIELEQMKLDQTQNMSATLKAIRGSAVD